MTNRFLIWMLTGYSAEIVLQSIPLWVVPCTLQHNQNVGLWWFLESNSLLNCFQDLEISADLTSVGCGKYQYICAQIRRDDPEPSYKQVGKTLQGTLGCAPVECGSRNCFISLGLSKYNHTNCHIIRWTINLPEGTFLTLFWFEC